MKLRRCSSYQFRAAQECEKKLCEALALAKIADSPKLLPKIRKAIKSAGGAVRHASRRLNARPVYGVLHPMRDDREAFANVETPKLKVA